MARFFRLQAVFLTMKGMKSMKVKSVKICEICGRISFWRLGAFA